jgi:hypothetical protein
VGSDVVTTFFSSQNIERRVNPGCYIVLSPSPRAPGDSSAPYEVVYVSLRVCLFQALATYTMATSLTPEVNI